MKKMKLSVLIASTLAMSGLLCSCSGSDPDEVRGNVNSKNIDYTADNADNWHQYSVIVARLLAQDSGNLLASWMDSYDGGDSFAGIFRNHNGNGYTSPLNCIEEILDGCADIANEVGEAKIGDPYDLYSNGKTEEALYAVESWYSWHSRDDYSNNILSIRNSYFNSLDSKVNPVSISALVEKLDPALNAEVISSIENAYSSILAIPQPFRNNINSEEARRAMTACGELDQVITRRLKPLFLNLDSSYDGELSAIVNEYVDVVVLPTYKLLKERNEALLAAIVNLDKNRSDSSFEAACEAWLAAREPWEKSEAFLFGPVDALGLDPNMDSWPLDQDAIVNHLSSGSPGDLVWNAGDDDEKIESAQNVRGFHTLEFLLFKDGKPRKVSK